MASASRTARGFSTNWPAASSMGCTIRDSSSSVTPPKRTRFTPDGPTQRSRRSDTVHRPPFEHRHLCRAAALLAVVGWRLRQPLILAYLVTGFVIGPHGLNFVTNQASITTVAEI